MKSTNVKCKSLKMACLCYSLETMRIETENSQTNAFNTYINREKENRESKQQQKIRTKYIILLMVCVCVLFGIVSDAFEKDKVFHVVCA